jgi:hypothetical protein
MIKKEDLISELKKNVQAPPAAKSAKTQRASRRTPELEGAPAPTEAASRQFTGRTLGFWGDDEDRAILRELALALFQAGLKPSESLAIRAAIRLVQKDHHFIEQARAVLERDGRRLRHQKEVSQVKS